MEEVRTVAELGYALAEMERAEDALTIFTGLAALAPATAYFQAALGALKLRAGRTTEAIVHLNAALASDPQDLSALVNRGEAALQLGQLAAALADWRAAIQLLPRAKEEQPSLLRARALLAHYA